MRNTLVVLLLFAVLPLPAEMSAKVISAFKGQIIITRGGLPEGTNDKDTIAKIKKAQLKEIQGEAADNGPVRWTFSYAAFPAQSGANLRLVFSLAGKVKSDKHLSGVDPKSSVLTGEISVDEDEGIERGKVYTVELTNGKKSLAQTKLLLK